ncbi:MAG: site-specific DNA-methyltransferase [Alphaproteobacteria bacterium]|nr:site-specific DNA-methyltransferase [Alphaproteobacteria bacterium]
MVLKKSQRNKTLDLSVEAGQKYLKKCLTEKSDLSSLLAVENKTILGDAFKILPKLPRGFVDLLIVDPPYNLNKDYEGKKFKAVSDEEYEKYTASWIEKILPLLKPNASVYVCCDWKSSVVIGAVLKKYFHVQNRITWQREKGRGAKSNWKNAMEDIWFATISENYTFNLDAVKLRRKVIAPYKKNGAPKDWEQTLQGKFRNTCPSNFWDDICVPYWSMAENTAHPTQKPEKLIAKLILASSNEGDVVFDPFAGSGTTSVTAMKLKRRYVGIEQNERYCVWAEKRIEDAQNDTRIQGYENGVFLPRNEKFE